MVGLFEIYKEHFKVDFLLKMQYPFDALMVMLEMAVAPIIYLLVWRTVATANGGEIHSFNAGTLATYYIIFTFVRQFVTSPGMWLFEWRIREGHMSVLMLRPLHPIHIDIAEIVSFKLFSVIIITPIVIIMTIAFEAHFNATWWMWLLFVPAVCLGAAVRFMVRYTLSILGFWTTRIYAIEQMYIIAQTFFGGTLAPLALLPVPLLTIASWLPFRWMLAFPIELAMGRLSTQEIVGGFVAQVLWLVGAIGAMSVLWRVAVRHYGAVGG